MPIPTYNCECGEMVYEGQRHSCEDEATHAELVRRFVALLDPIVVEESNTIDWQFGD